MRRRRRSERPERRETRLALDRAERELHAAEHAHRIAYAAEFERWAECGRGERPPEDVRTQLARQATEGEHLRLMRARVEAAVAQRAYWAAQQGEG